MKPIVKQILNIVIPLVVLLILVMAWICYFHNDWLLAHTPGFLHAPLQKLGQRVDVPPPEEEEPDPNLNQIPVHVGKITKETLHRYIEGYGVVAPSPPRKDHPAGSANIAAPVAGLVSKVDVQIGQKVKAGDLILELDNRLAKAAEEQAAAALAQEEAALAALKATPRPAQVELAQLAIDKAQSAVELAQKNYDRQKQLAAEQNTAQKNVEQAAGELAAAQNDLQSARKQMDILKASPTAEELQQEQAKVAQMRAALSTAHLQAQLTQITAPIDATVTAIDVNPGESVDTTKTLITLIAMDRLIVDVDVPADELPAETGGLSAVITLAGQSGAGSAPIDGKVAFAAPQVESKNGAVMVGIDIPADANLRPGLTVRVRIIAEEHKDVLAVPKEAVVIDANNDANIAVVTGETANMHAVKPGLEENGLMEITTDLKEGTTVVTQGTYGLRTVDNQPLQQTHIKILEDKK